MRATTGGPTGAPALSNNVTRTALGNWAGDGQLGAHDGSDSDATPTSIPRMFRRTALIAAG